MPTTITIPRADVTSEEVCRTLRDGLGDHYHVIPDVIMGQMQITGSRPATEPGHILVGTGSNQTFKAEVKISRQGEQTIISIKPGGLIWPRVVNTFGIARKVRDVLTTSL